MLIWMRGGTGSILFAAERPFYQSDSDDSRVRPSRSPALSMAMAFCTIRCSIMTTRTRFIPPLRPKRRAI